jgi:hypothetical protein
MQPSNPHGQSAPSVSLPADVIRDLSTIIGDSIARAMNASMPRTSSADTHASHIATERLEQELARKDAAEMAAG